MKKMSNRLQKKKFEVVKTKIGLLAYVLKENNTSVTFFENVSAIS